jgi:hypothetical protein
MLLASFVAGLAGTPRRQARFEMPGTVEEALKIATTVTQAEIRNEATNHFIRTRRYRKLRPQAESERQRKAALVGEASVITQPHPGRATGINSRQALMCTLGTRGPANLLGVMSVAESETSNETVPTGTDDQLK